MHSHMICTRPCAIVTNSTTFRSCPLLEAGFKRLKKRSDPGNGTAPGGNQRRQTGRPSRLQHPLQVVLTDGVSEPLLVVEMSLNSTTYPDLPVPVDQPVHRTTDLRSAQHTPSRQARAPRDAEILFLRRLLLSTTATPAGTTHRTPSLLAGLFVAFFCLGVHVGSRIGSVVRRLIGCLPWVLARARGIRFCGVAVGGALRPVFSPSSPKPGWPTIPLHRGGSTRHLGRGGSAHHPAEGAALHHTGSAASVHAAADTPPLTGRVRRHGCRANSQG